MLAIKDDEAGALRESSFLYSVFIQTVFCVSIAGARPYPSFTVFRYKLQNCTGVKEISSAERQEITCSLKYHKSHNHPALQLFYLN